MVIFHLNTAFSRQIGLSDLGLSLLGGTNTLGSPAWWIVRLDLGVKVFFAISGMVLALPFLRQYLLNESKIELKDYLYRRLTRLEPPFVFTLLVFLFIHVMLLGKQASEMIPHFLAGLLYAHVFIFGQPNPINPVTWSLETEAQFYLLVPFFFSLLFYNKTHLWKAVVIILCFTASVWIRDYFFRNGFAHLGSSVLTYFSNFLIGIMVAWLYLKRGDFFQKKVWLWDVLGLLAIISQFYFYKPQHHFVNNILFNISILLMMVATFKGNLMNWVFTRPLVYIIGGMCYSIYLLHYAFFHLLVRLTAKLSTGAHYGADLLIQIVVCIPIVILFSSLFYILFEKPFMNKEWPKDILKILNINK